MMKTLWIICVGVTLLAAGIAQGEAPACLSANDAANLVQTNKVKSFRAVWEIVSQRVSGHPVGEQLCPREGGYAYFISVKDGAVIRHVIVDAKRGTIVSSR